jgi:hypothetical protein
MSKQQSSIDNLKKHMVKGKKFKLSVAKREISDKHKRLTDLIGKALVYTANEPWLLVRFEEFLSPKPASLDFSRPVTNRLNKLTEKMGGVPRLIVYKTGEKLPEFDTYGDAAIHEVAFSFQRCRRSVCRTHVCFVASEFYKQHPDVFVQRIGPAIKRGLAASMEEVFWEHAETSYIRLASYWDRIGQFLDFIFFNIRQYERDGFPSVMDRISSNYVRLFPDLESAPSWAALRNYQRSEKQDGFQFLIRRRNLLVHSVHLEAIQSKAGGENPIFTSAYNHLEESVHRKLKPDTPESELAFLHAHLSAAAKLFPSMIELCEHCAASRLRTYRGF